LRAARYSDHYEYADERRRPLLSQIRRAVLALQAGLVETITAGQRIAYRKPNKKIFLELKVQKEAIVLHMANLEGLDDPADFLMTIPETHEWGQLSRRATVRTADDLAQALRFIRSSWMRS
jgi:hypothetical protein